MKLFEITSIHTVLVYTLYILCLNVKQLFLKFQKIVISLKQNYRKSEIKQKAVFHTFVNQSIEVELIHNYIKFVNTGQRNELDLR